MAALDPHDQSSSQTQPTGLEQPLELLVNWSLLTVIGYLVGDWIGGHAASLLVGLSGFAADAARGCVLGLAVGACQWWLLTPRLPTAWPWIPLTAAGFALSLVVERLGDMAASVWGLLGFVVMVAAAALVGLVQWLYLRRRFEQAAWWIAALAAYGFARYVLVRTTFLITPAVWVYDLLEALLLAAATGYAMLVYLDRLPTPPPRQQPRFRSLRPKARRRPSAGMTNAPPASPAAPTRQPGAAQAPGAKPVSVPGNNAGAAPARRTPQSEPPDRTAAGTPAAAPLPAGSPAKAEPVDPAWDGLIPGTKSERTRRPGTSARPGVTARPAAASGPSRPHRSEARQAGPTRAPPAEPTPEDDVPTPPRGTRRPPGLDAVEPAGTDGHEPVAQENEKPAPPADAGVKLAKQVRLAGDDPPRQVVLLKKKSALAATAQPHTTALGFGFEMGRRPRRARLRMAYTGMTTATQIHFRQHVELNGAVLYELQPRSQKLQETTEYALRIPPESFARTNQLVFVSRSGGTPQQKNPFQLQAVILDLDW